MDQSDMLEWHTHSDSIGVNPKHEIQKPIPLSPQSNDKWFTYDILYRIDL